MLPRVFILSALLAAAGPVAHATPYTWTEDGTDNLWSDAQNWSGGQRPISGMDATVTFAGVVNLQPSQDLAADFVLNSPAFANTYTGGTIFASDTVTAGSARALGSSGALSFFGGPLQYSAAHQTDHSARFSTAPGQNYSVDTNGQNVAFATSLAASGNALTKRGAGTLPLTGSNAFSAGVALVGGTLNVGSPGALGTTGTLSFTGGTLQYSAANRTGYSARFSTADYHTSLDINGQDVTLASGFASTHGGFTKLGQGKLTVLGAITSGFATMVKEGSVEVPADGSISNSYVVISGGATFEVNGGTVGASSSGFELGTTAGTATIHFSAGTLNNVEGDIGYAAGGLAIFNQTGDTSNASMNVGSVKGSEAGTP